MTYPLALGLVGLTGDQSDCAMDDGRRPPPPPPPSLRSTNCVELSSYGRGWYPAPRPLFFRRPRAGPAPPPPPLPECAAKAAADAVEGAEGGPWPVRCRVRWSFSRRRTMREPTGSQRCAHFLANVFHLPSAFFSASVAAL